MASMARTKAKALRLRSRGLTFLLACLATLSPWASAWLAPRRQALLAGGVAASLTAPEVTSAFDFFGGSNTGDARFDSYGRLLWSDGKTLHPEGAAAKYNGSVLFLGKPKVFVAGSTGELGRRVVVDILQNGMSVYVGYRDYSKTQECGYVNKTTTKYEVQLVPDVLISTGRKEALERQLQEAAVVVHVAGARRQFDILRPFQVGFDDREPEDCDLNGTIALVDAAVARGVKRFIYVSAVLVNGKKMGVDETDAYKNLNSYGGLLEKKLQAEDYIKKSGLDYTIIRPAPMNNDDPRSVGSLYFAEPDTFKLERGEVGEKVSRDDVSMAIVDSIFNEKASRGTFELVDAKSTPTLPRTPREKWWETQRSVTPK